MRSEKLILLLFISSLFCSQLSGQSKSKNSSFKLEIGGGISLLGTGDISMSGIVVELDYLLNKRLELSSNLTLARGQTNRVTFSSGMTQSNFNLQAILMNVGNKYELKIGGGLSYISYDSVRARSGSTDSSGVFVVSEYAIREENSFGYNLLIENIYKFSKAYSIGIVIFGQNYFSGDTNFGGNLKLGVTL